MNNLILGNELHSNISVKLERNSKIISSDDEKFIIKYQNVKNLILTSIFSNLQNSSFNNKKISKIKISWFSMNKDNHGILIINNNPMFGYMINQDNQDVINVSYSFYDNKNNLIGSNVI